MIESVYDRVGVSSGWNVRESGAKQVSRGHALRAKVSLRFEIGRRKLPQDSGRSRAKLVWRHRRSHRSAQSPGLVSRILVTLTTSPVYR